MIYPRKSNSNERDDKKDESSSDNAANEKLFEELSKS